MPVVPVTRLRLRSWRFLLPFFRHASRSLRQARAAPGNLFAEVRKSRGLAFCSASVWRDEPALSSDYRSGARQRAMPKLRPWCDQAVTVRFEQDGDTLPGCEELARRLATDGRLFPLLHPSREQREGRVVID